MRLLRHALASVLWPGAAALTCWALWGGPAALAAAALTCWILWILERGRLLRLRWLLRRARPADASGVMSGGMTGVTHGVTPDALWGRAWGEVLARIALVGRDAQARIAERDQRLEAVFSALHASPNAVVFLDPHQRIEWCNQRAAQLLGLDGVRDRGQSILHLLRDPAFVACCTGGAEGEAEGQTEGGAEKAERAEEIEMQRGDRHLAVQLHPCGSGRSLLLARDISALQRARALQRDFVANISHEIRTPLTVLAGFVETLQSLELDADARAQCLEAMAQQAARMQRLVQDLLHLARLEADSGPQKPQWLPLAEVIGRCHEDACALAQRLATRHRLHFPDPAALEQAGHILADPHELHSALGNLVDNALRHTPAGGRVELSWERLPDGGGQFVLRDSGAGIAPGHLAHLTRRFYRIDPGRGRADGGSGLGLAIVQHVLQGHGARLHVASTPGQGSTFCAIFPASRLRGGQRAGNS